MPSIKIFKRKFWRLWGMPLVLGVLSVIGLLSALIGNGFMDVLSWLLLGSLIGVIYYCLRK